MVINELNAHLEETWFEKFPTLFLNTLSKTSTIELFMHIYIRVSHWESISIVRKAVVSICFISLFTSTVAHTCFTTINSKVKLIVKWYAEFTMNEVAHNLHKLWTWFVFTHIPFLLLQRYRSQLYAGYGVEKANSIRLRSGRLRKISGNAWKLAYRWIFENDSPSYNQFGPVSLRLGSYFQAQKLN